MRSTHLSRFHFALIGVGLLVTAPVLPAADPVAEVLRLAPKDASIGLLVRDLRGHYDAVANGPLAEAIRATPLGKGIAAAPELAQLEGVVRHLEKILGMDIAKLREDVFGDAIVFTYQSAGVDPPRPESAIFLTWARDP